MNREEAIQALLALAQAEAQRQWEEEQKAAASESLAAAKHWDGLVRAVADHLGEVAYAVAKVDPPKDWSSAKSTYLVPLILPGHTPIYTRFTHDGQGWRHHPWGMRLSETEYPGDKACWYVAHHGEQYFARLGAALVAAHVGQEEEIPF